MKHRIALGLVGYPAAAAYLLQHYELLQSRVFKQKNIRSFNRRWYEYLWPRDANIMLGKPRLLSPSLIRSVRFVLDSDGYLSDHACLMMQPTQETVRAWEKFSDVMNRVLGKTLSKKELLQYCLAFMNSSYAQERLVTGHRPTPKGSYQVTEAFLREIPIPSPPSKKTAKAIIELVEDLDQFRPGVLTHNGSEELETRLDALVRQSLETV